MTAQTPDIAIVGAGIAGASAAFQLVKAGINTIIIEKSGIAGQASGWNPGGLNPMHGVGIPGPMSEFALSSFRMHLELEDELLAHAKRPFHLRPTPRVQLAISESEESKLLSLQSRFNSTPGFSAEFLGREELRNLYPAFKAPVRSGLLQIGNYSVDTSAYAEALVNAAQAGGLGVVTGEVTGLRSKGRLVTELQIGTETLAVGGVLFANGPWSCQAGNWLQFEIPVHSVGGQLLVAETPDAKFDFDITYGLSGIYVQPDGSKILGGTEEDHGLDPAPTEAGKTTIISQINRFVDLGRMRFKSHGAAGRPVSSDQLPIVGKVPDWENAYILTGGGRKGVLYSSGMGYAITQEIVAAKQWPLASNLSPARFMNRN